MIPSWEYFSVMPTAKIAPPFTLETATQKVQMAEDAWNSRDPERVALAYSPDSEWRNRTEFLRGREEIKSVPPPEVGAGARLPVEKDLVGLPREPHCRELRV